MRTRILNAFVLSLVLGVPSALAQEEGEEQDTQQEEQEGGETEGAEVVDPGQVRTTPPSPTGGGRETAPGETHTVVGGDTLWDLSQRYLGNAWYWPKVWSYNPQIANPHWIYPGNLVRFFPEAEERPTQVETGEGPADAVQPGELEGGTEPGTEFVSDEPDDTIEVAGRIGRPLPKAEWVLRDRFVTPREIDESGTIVGAFTESLMLSGPDEVYVKFKGAEARVGDRYIIFRTDREIQHPKKGGRYGYVTQILGTARVIRGGSPATLRIEDTWDEIGRGDLVGPYGERLITQVAPRPATQNLDGYVLASAISHITMAAEFHIVFVDRGSADGVEMGQEFIVMRQGDAGGRFINPTETDNKDFPWEDIAVCMTVDVKETASACLLKRSLREIYPGDRVQMRAEGGAPVSRR